ncbi:MAG: putative adenylate/guanylate cyclase [Chthoniobacteraceae bacterium]|nr:putative adenylate/guanylate cyclase [Chthoniobacteraceae bacterium]
MFRLTFTPVRYFKVSILIGILVTLGIVALYETGMVHRLDVWLAALLAQNAPFPGDDRAVQYALAIFFGLGIAWTTIDINRPVLKFVIAAGAIIEVLAAVWVLGLRGIVFSPCASLLAISGSFVLGFAYSCSEAGMRKRVARAIFGDRISKRTLSAIVDSDMPLKFEGEKRHASVVVCEIFNHETLAEALPVSDYVAMHNAFLRNAADLLVDRGGYLDECDGESLRVVFGTPLADEEHAATACEAALALAERLDAVNGECVRIWHQIFDFRIGINSGELVVAAYGSSRLGSFSVAGEPVEFARRLCAANTIYGSGLLMGATTLGSVESLVEVRPMELIQRYPDDHSREEVYELLGLQGKLSEEEHARRDLFWKGIIYYRQQLWDEALTFFHSARRPDGSDGPVEFYIRRIEQLREGLPALEAS